MAELLVRIVDKSNPDPMLDIGCMKRGDVIAVCPDGWRWGNQELRNPAWRIFRVPDAPELYSALLAPDVPDIGRETDPVRKRGFRLDLDALATANAALAAHLNANGEAPYEIDRADGGRTTIAARAAVKFDGLSPADVQTATTRKPAVVLPNAIGDSRRVIG